jgi:hypothetical protein
MVQVCTKCGNELPEADFYKDPRRENGLRTVCKSCWASRKKAYKEAHKEEISAKNRLYYEANKERISTRIRHWRKDNHKDLMERQRKKRQRAGELLMQLKTPCVKCGEGRMWVIQFHHIDPSQKEFELSAENVSHKKLETVRQEAAKCACLCANCHTEFHHFYGKTPETPAVDFIEYMGGV